MIQFVNILIYSFESVNQNLIAIFIFMFFVSYYILQVFYYNGINTLKVSRFYALLSKKLKNIILKGKEWKIKDRTEKYKQQFCINTALSRIQCAKIFKKQFTYVKVFCLHKNTIK